LEFYKQHPNKDLPHPEAVDWLTKEWFKRTWKVFRDPDRWIRSLSQQWYLVKVGKGMYRFDPDFVLRNDLEDFTPEQKKKILERDNYKCVVCGRGKADGVELQIDHIKPKDKGGKAEVENWQTLCAMHNFRKKNYSQTETGKKMFINLLGLAKKNNDAVLEGFCEDILSTFEKHDINGHIEWRKSDGKTKRLTDKSEIL
jgi:hypothetical protein